MALFTFFGFRGIPVPDEHGKLVRSPSDIRIQFQTLPVLGIKNRTEIPNVPQFQPYTPTLHSSLNYLSFACDITVVSMATNCEVTNP